MKELDAHWNAGQFSFDSSVLLSIFRLRELRDNFLDIAKKLEGRIFTPHQVALEFHLNRKSVLKNEVQRDS